MYCAVLYRTYGTGLQDHTCTVCPCSVCSVLCKHRPGHGTVMRVERRLSISSTMARTRVDVTWAECVCMYILYCTVQYCPVPTVQAASSRPTLCPHALPSLGLGIDLVRVSRLDWLRSGPLLVVFGDLACFESRFPSWPRPLRPWEKGEGDAGRGTRLGIFLHDWICPRGPSQVLSSEGPQSLFWGRPISRASFA